MKKILEVTLDEKKGLVFGTDVDVTKDPSCIIDITIMAMMAMSTTLWGGNEASVLAVIRSLCSADIALAVNRKEMIKMLDEQTKYLAASMQDTLTHFKKNGAEIHLFAPNVANPFSKKGKNNS